MHSRIPLLAFLFAIVFLALPSAAYAGGIPFLGPIIPDAYKVCPASWGLLITVINNIISLAITLAIVFIAPIMIAYAGFLYVVNPVNPSGMSKAKGILQNTVIGIVVMLAAWLIVDAIMAVLYKPSDSWGTWSSLITGRADDTCLQQAGVLPEDKLSQATLNSVAVVPAFTPDIIGERMIRNTFTAAGVGVNKPNCNPIVSSCGVGTPPSCTNLSGMRNDTINQVIALAKAVKSNSTNKYVVVTAGTEPGHACSTNYPAYTHQNGYKVDLAMNNKLDAYIESMAFKGYRDAPQNKQPIYSDICPGGNQYVYEDDHWDITVKQYCPTMKLQ